MCPLHGYQRNVYGSIFFDEVFGNDNLKSVKNWDLVQRPLKQMCLV